MFEQLQQRVIRVVCLILHLTLNDVATSSVSVASVRRTKQTKAPPTQSCSEGNLQTATALVDVWIQLEAFKSLQKQRAKFSVCH